VARAPNVTRSRAAGAACGWCGGAIEVRATGPDPEVGTRRPVGNAPGRYCANLPSRPGEERPARPRHRAGRPHRRHNRGQRRVAHVVSRACSHSNRSQTAAHASGTLDASPTAECQIWHPRITRRPPSTDQVTVRAGRCPRARNIGDDSLEFVSDRSCEATPWGCSAWE